MKYKVGDIVELVYRDILGSGEIIKIEESFFSTTYLIKTTVTSTYFLKYEHTREEVLRVKEKDIIKVLWRNENEKKEI